MAAGSTSCCAAEVGGAVFVVAGVEELDIVNSVSRAESRRADFPHLLRKRSENLSGMSLQNLIHIMIGLIKLFIFPCASYDDISSLEC